MRRLASPRVWAGLLLGLALLYTLTGFFLLPYLITAYGVPAAADFLKRPVVVREAAFNPFTLALRVNGLEVQDSDRKPVIGFEELVVDLRVTTLFGRMLGFDEIRLVMPFVSAKVNREGKLNLLALVPPPGTPDPSKPEQSATNESKALIPVEIGLLEIDKGVVEYRDESKAKPVSMDIVPIQITLRNFSTMQGSDNAYAFRAEIGKGELVTWEGTVSLEPLESDGKVNLSGVKISTLFQAIHDLFQFDVQQGEIALSAQYHADLRGQAPRVTVNNGQLNVRDLSIGERGIPEPLVKVPAFDIEGIHIDLEKQAVEVDAIRTSDGHLEAWMNPGGVLNLQQLFAPAIEAGSAGSASTPAAPQSDKTTQPWSVSVREVEVRNYGTAFEDRTLARPQYVDVDNLNVRVKEIRLPFKQPMPVDLSMRLNRTGSITVKGRVAVEPMSADLELGLKEIGIQPFQGYLDRFINMDVQDGVINLAGTVRYAELHAKGPLLRFQGDVAVNRLSVSDRKEFDEVLSWKSLAVNRVVLEVEPTSVKVAELVWQEPAVHAVIDSDGSINLLNIMAQPPSDATPHETAVENSRPATTRSAPPTVTIDQVKLVKAAASFQDLSIQPSVKTGVSDFSGTIRGLSSKQMKKADVDLAGRVDKVAPLKISGKINPLSEDAFTDVVMTLGGMDLTPASPYSGKYAGYGLSKGKLSLDLKYKVSQKLLEAENLVSIDQLTFGAKVESPDATSLPVPLLVALLQDRKGLIEIDLPIRGDLNDPDFKYGKVVISTLFNLLGKVVASPFTLLGKLVPDGGSGDDLQFIAFPPGTASLIPAEAAKLEALGKALVERARLRLDIKGTADAALDRAALRLLKLKDRLLAMKRQEFGSSGKEEELSAEDDQRLVSELFAALHAKQSDAAGTAPKGAEEQRPTLDEMRRRVAEQIPVSDAELESLARHRSEIVRDRLLEGGQLDPDRIFLLDLSIAESGHENVRTQLGLAAGS